MCDKYFYINKLLPSTLSQFKLKAPNSGKIKGLKKSNFACQCMFPYVNYIHISPEFSVQN